MDSSLESPAHGGSPLIASLDPLLYQDNRDCLRCEGVRIFVPVYETEFGRLGYCMGCGDERIVPFTRTTMEEQ